ncbi:MAG: 50S ribosomal protein L1 [Chloroflexi bacterium]|jgi:large subunit ribosomal protein L1|nr:50S ribosomal protein L1 [Chloroflexota bacterium]
MSKKGKNFINASQKVEADRSYSPREAIDLVKELAFAKFDETVEIHIRTGLDPRQADQQIRDVTLLPKGLGKTVRVLVFAQGEAASAARAAGADFVAETDEDLARIQGGYTDFDVAVGTMDMMGKVGRLGRVLGPRNLMPNPKAGTVVQPDDIAQAIETAKAGRVEFRLDKSANIHVPLGKVSFSAADLYENMAALTSAVRKARPAGAKGQFIKRVTLASTMGPGVKVDVNSAMNMETEAV